jgi:hypothetical protein
MEFISRQKVFEDQIFASFISGWQDQENPAKNSAIEAGEYFDDATDSLRFFSKKELIEIREHEITAFKKISDNLTKQAIEMTCKIVIDAPDNTDEIQFLSETMAAFATKHSLTYTFIPLFKTPWFSENIEGHHPSTKIAHTNFKKYIGDENYNGGILVSDYSELKEMLTDYFNLIQGNYYGYIFFYSEALKTVFSFHYSGQIWFYIYTKESKSKIEAFISKNDLIINERYTSYNR